MLTHLTIPFLLWENIQWRFHYTFLISCILLPQTDETLQGSGHNKFRSCQYWSKGFLKKNCYVTYLFYDWGENPWNVPKKTWGNSIITSRYNCRFWPTYLPPSRFVTSVHENPLVLRHALAQHKHSNTSPPPTLPAPSTPFPNKKQIFGFKKDESRSMQISFLFHMFFHIIWRRHFSRACTKNTFLQHSNINSNIWT